MSRVLVTGASGFIGRAVLARLASETGMTARGSVRTAAANFPAGFERVIVDELGPDTDWSRAVAGAGAIVHTAARVHVGREFARDPLSEFRRVNVAGTLALARQAAEAGVQRFVFLSSIKVNGEETRAGQMFSEADVPAPVDPYGISKLEAEEELFSLGHRTGMGIAVIRPVLVYGPGVKGNFLTLMKWLNRGVPLPLGRIENRRSLVALDNLVSLIMTCLVHPAAPGRKFMVSDGEDLSTTELLRRTARALGRAPRLVPVPSRLLLAAAQVAGKGDMARRLIGSLQVDMRTTREVLGWAPPVGVDDALRATADHYLRHDDSNRRRSAA